MVTLFGLIGTITTGFLGMNLLAEAEAPLLTKILWFSVVFAFTTWLTVYTMVKSQRLSDFIDTLSDDQKKTADELLAPHMGMMAMMQSGQMESGMQPGR